MACPKHLKCPPFRSQNLKSLRAGSEAPGTRVIHQMLFFPPGEGDLKPRLQIKGQSPLPPRSQPRSAKIVSPFYRHVN